MFLFFPAVLAVREGWVNLKTGIDTHTNTEKEHILPSGIRQSAAWNTTHSTNSKTPKKESCCFYFSRFNCSALTKRYFHAIKYTYCNWTHSAVYLLSSSLFLEGMCTLHKTVYTHTFYVFSCFSARLKWLFNMVSCTCVWKNMWKKYEIEAAATIQLFRQSLCAGCFKSIAYAFGLVWFWHWIHSQPQICSLTFFYLLSSGSMWFFLSFNPIFSF